MPSNAYYRALVRARGANLRGALGDSFAEKPQTRTATVIDGGTVKVGNQRYAASGVANANTGATIAVRNIGTRANAIYAPDAGDTIAFASAGGSGSGTGGGGAGAFTDLADTFGSYAGRAGQYLKVNAGPSGVTSGTIADGDLPSTLVRTARTLTGGDGIQAIGDLSADRTISVDSSVARTSTEIVAGAGLTGGGTIAASRTINVGAGAGITVNANDVALTTPGSLSATSTNSSSGSHTHAIDSTIARSAIQINSGNGLTGGGDLTANRTLNVGAGTGITVNSNDVAVNQAYAFAWTANHSWTGNLQHPDYASQTTNWRITSAGAADFRYLFADEMHVKSFIADLEQALAGGQIISKSVAVLSRNFTAPAAGGTATLYVWDLPSAENMAVFQSGDMVRLRSFSRAGGSLTVADCWGVVTSYSNLTDKEQSWIFTRSAAPNAGGISSGAVIAADSLVLDYGTTGNGFHEVNAIDGAYGANSPYAQTVTWSGHPASGQTVRTRTGNLTGLAFPSQLANEYGFYAGNGRQVADQYVRISTWGNELHNLPLNLYSGGVSTISINPSHPSTGKPAIAVGVNADNVTYYANEGVWMGLDGNNPAWRVGDPNGDYISYINGVLTVRGRIEVTEGDLGASPYRIAATMASVQAEYDSSQYVQFVPSAPHDYGSGICGKITMADGNVYWLKVDTANTLLNRSGSRIGYLTVKKARDTGDNVSSVGSIDYPDQTNATGYTPVINVYAYNLGDYDILSAAQKNNRLVIADLWMSPDISAINSIVWRAPSQMTVITPEYIRTPNLSVIANGVLGPITSGSIEVGSTNKLWLNVNDDPLKLAIGPNATGRNNAPFRVYENGRTFIGDSGGSYIEWNSPNLSIVGNITATEGTLGNLSVSGTVSVYGETGKISWANGDGFLDRFGIYYAEKAGSSLAAVLRVGRPAPFAQGMIDVDMFAEADSQWDYAFHVTDGGNSNNSYSALYHGQSAVPGTGAVDRIFNAYTTNAAYSDGYYSDLAAGIWADFDSSGVSFKGISRGGQPVAVFQQVGGGAAGPVVFAGSDQNNRAMYVARGATGATFQAGFKVDPSGAVDFIALDAGDAMIGYTKAVMLKDTSDSNVPTPPSGYYMLYVNSNSLKIKRADGRVQFYSQAGEYLP